MTTKASPSADKSSFKQWLIVPLFSFLLYRYIYNKTEPSTPTFDVVKNFIGGSPWQSFPGSFRLTPAFPDHASRYDVLSFRPTDTGDFDVIEIKGQFPYARYFGVNLYDFNEATDFAALADREVIPNAGSRNPYAIGDYNKNSIPLTERYYTIWLVSESVARRLRNEQQQQKQRAMLMDHVNIMTYPDGIPTLTLMNRVYRPNIGHDSLGGVPLPTVEAFKLDGTQATAPQLANNMDVIKTKVPMFLFNKDIIKTWELMKEFSPNNQVKFRRVAEAGLFPNRHMKYIVAALDQYYWNKVAVVTIKKTPTVDDTFHGGDFQKDVNVRYWSFCVGDNAITGTPSCLLDDQIRHNNNADDGSSSVTIVVAPFYLKSKVEQAGLNYLAWGLSYKPLLIHRHMLAADKDDEDDDNDFSGNVIGNIPTIGRPPAKEDWNADYFERHSAHHWMGDYAPKGKILGVSEFVKRLTQGDFRVAF